MIEQTRHQPRRAWRRWLGLGLILAALTTVVGALLNLVWLVLPAVCLAAIGVVAYDKTGIASVPEPTERNGQ